jgi:hypothetical protein
MGLESVDAFPITSSAPKHKNNCASIAVASCRSVRVAFLVGAHASALTSVE